MTIVAINEREQDGHGGEGYWDVDQRFSVMDSQYMHKRTNVEDYPFR